MKSVALLFVPALALLFWLPAAGDQPATAPPVARTEAQDLFFFHDARPIFFRLHIYIDGRPFQTSWNDYLDQLFRYILAALASAHKRRNRRCEALIAHRSAQEFV